MRRLLVAFAIWLTLFNVAQSAGVVFRGTRPANSNAISSIGTNLNGISQFSGEQPFANIMSNYSGWFPDVGDGSLLCLDANGWVTTFANQLTGVGGTCTAAATFSNLTIILNNALPTPLYPGGTYDVEWTGSCTFVYSFDAVLLSHISGTHDTITVTPSVNGIKMLLTAIGAGAGYCRNVSVTRAALTSAYLAGCQQFAGGTLGASCFDPNFLKLLAPFRAVRFMDWMCTNQNTNATTSSSFSTVGPTGRPGPAMPFFGSPFDINNGTTHIPCGVPVEFMVALCNAGNFDCWFNMPTLASDSFVSGFAAYVAANLKSTLYAYMEFSNETWNFGFTAFNQLIDKIGSVQPANYSQGGVNCAVGNQSQNCNRSVMGHQTSHFCALWNTAWAGITNRMKCVLAAQAADPNSAVNALNCVSYIGGGNCTPNIQYVAIAPYFGSDAGIGPPACSPTCTPGTTTSFYPDGSIDPSFSPSASFLTDGSGGLNSLFTAFNTGGNMNQYPADPPGHASQLSQVSGWQTAYVTAVTNVYGFPIISYEGGQSLSSFAYDPTWTTPMVAAQKDSRMGTTYTTYYNNWRANGGQLFMHFNDTGAFAKFGSWGFVDTSCASSCANPSYAAYPKYTATRTWIFAHPCNWTTALSQPCKH